MADDMRFLYLVISFYQAIAIEGKSQLVALSEAQRLPFWNEVMLRHRPAFAQFITWDGDMLMLSFADRDVRVFLRTAHTVNENGMIEDNKTPDEWRSTGPYTVQVFSRTDPLDVFAERADVTSVPVPPWAREPIATALLSTDTLFVTVADLDAEVDSLYREMYQSALRMRVYGGQMQALIAALEDQHSPAYHLLLDLLGNVNETELYRYPQQYGQLRSVFAQRLKEALARRVPGAPSSEPFFTFRVLSLGAADGKEMISAAVSVLNEIKKIDGWESWVDGVRCSFSGVDIDSRRAQMMRAYLRNGIPLPDDDQARETTEAVNRFLPEVQAMEERGLFRFSYTITSLTDPSLGGDLAHADAVFLNNVFYLLDPAIMVAVATEVLSVMKNGALLLSVDIGSEPSVFPARAQQAISRLLRERFVRLSTDGSMSAFQRQGGESSEGSLPTSGTSSAIPPAVTVAFGYEGGIPAEDVLVPGGRLASLRGFLDAVYRKNGLEETGDIVIYGGAIREEILNGGVNTSDMDMLVRPFLSASERLLPRRDRRRLVRERAWAIVEVLAEELEVAPEELTAVGYKGSFDGMPVSVSCYLDEDGHPVRFSNGAEQYFVDLSVCHACLSIADGRVHDFHQGRALEDIRTRTARFVGIERVEDLPLPVVLRAIRFLLQYGLTPDERTTELLHRFFSQDPTTVSLGTIDLLNGKGVRDHAVYNLFDRILRYAPDRSAAIRFLRDIDPHQMIGYFSPAAQHIIDQGYVFHEGESVEETGDGHVEGIQALLSSPALLMRISRLYAHMGDLYEEVSSLYQARQAGVTEGTDAITLLMKLTRAMNGYRMIDPDDPAVRQWFTRELENEGVADPDAYLQRVLDEYGRVRADAREILQGLVDRVASRYPPTMLPSGMFASRVNRHPKEYRYFAEVILPRLVASRHGAAQTITIAVIGPSRGEEMATLYYYIHEAFARHPEWGALSDWQVRIRGLEISADTAQQARANLYDDPSGLRAFGIGVDGDIVAALQERSHSEREAIFTVDHGSITDPLLREHLVADADAVFANVVLHQILTTPRQTVLDALYRSSAWILSTAREVYEQMPEARMGVELSGEGGGGTNAYFIVAPSEVTIEQPRIAVSLEGEEEGAYDLIDGIGEGLRTSASFNTASRRPDYERSLHVETVAEQIAEGRIRLLPSRIAALRVLVTDEHLPPDVRKFATTLLAAAGDPGDLPVDLLPPQELPDAALMGAAYPAIMELLMPLLTGA